MAREKSDYRQGRTGPGSLGWLFRPTGITTSTTLVSLLIATIINFGTKWNYPGVIVSTYCSAMFVFVLAVVLTQFVELDKVIRDSLNEMGSSQKGIAEVVKSAIRNYTLDEPAGLYKDFQQVISTILSIPSPRMQEEVITFTVATLEKMKDVNGFPLSETQFGAYRDRAQKFCDAMDERVDMTCLYTPLDYLAQLIDGAEPDPSHLEIFNGMTTSDGTLRIEGIPDRSRTRVMCVDRKLRQDIAQYPVILAAAVVWFFFHSSSFNSLCWSSETPRDDMIIFDEKFMWKYDPRARILYLKCAWDAAPGKAGRLLPEWREFFADDALAGLHDCICVHLHAIDSSENLWHSFCSALLSFFDLVSAEPPVYLQKSLAFSSFQKMIAEVEVHVRDKLDARNNRLMLREKIAEYWSSLVTGSLEHEEAFALARFMRRDYGTYMLNIFTNEIDAMLELIRERERDPRIQSAPVKDTEGQVP